MTAYSQSSGSTWTQQPTVRITSIGGELILAAISTDYGIFTRSHLGSWDKCLPVDDSQLISIQLLPVAVVSSFESSQLSLYYDGLGSSCVTHEGFLCSRSLQLALIPSIIRLNGFDGAVGCNPPSGGCHSRC